MKSTRRKGRKSAKRPLKRRKPRTYKARSRSKAAIRPRKPKQKRRAVKASARPKSLSVAKTQKGMRRSRARKVRRAAVLYLLENGRLRSFPFGKKAASEIGRYWNAVNRFLDANKISHLAPHDGVSVRDVYGKRHRLDTDPNILRRADSAGELSFASLYANTKTVI